MSGETDTAAAYGIGGHAGWIVGGALGGAIGAVAFGIVMWVLEPGVLAAAIPALYGIEPVGLVGWAIHIAHGALLGIVFGLLVTRPRVLGVLRTDVETSALSRIGIVVRTTAAGFVYGLTVWTVLPLLVLPAWIAAVGASGAEALTSIAAGSLLGHLVFGTVLGAVFAATVDLHDRTVETPF
ncbi:hypothetical protein [Natrinema salsiterrestre]|uniref:Histidine kinase n=1 Tax=Natrinema salsiterrestre TaxID=2950540 RepID=A0A9Q4Q2U4_9EURY|nr:hypothetical protein [Natrinema salsiterrestre]MDF9745322.1 hypothetical protein [Natrinema salsiterrestre]